MSEQDQESTQEYGGNGSLEYGENGSLVEYGGNDILAQGNRTETEPQDIPKKKYRAQRYRTKWENDDLFKSWLCQTIDGNAFCEACETIIQPRRASLVQHSKATKHRVAAKHYIAKSSSISEDVYVPNMPQNEDGPSTSTSTPTSSAPAPTRRPKRIKLTTKAIIQRVSAAKNNSSERTSMDLMKVCTQAMEKLTSSTHNEQHEYDAVGVSVGQKLRRMDPTQAIFAEAIIIKVLARGLLGSLSECTNLVDVMNTGDSKYMIS